MKNFAFGSIVGLLVGCVVGIVLTIFAASSAPVEPVGDTLAGVDGERAQPTSEPISTLPKPTSHTAREALDILLFAEIEDSMGVSFITADKYTSGLSNDGRAERWLFHTTQTRLASFRDAQSNWYASVYPPGYIEWAKSPNQNARDHFASGEWIDSTQAAILCAAPGEHLAFASLYMAVVYDPYAPGQVNGSEVRPVWSIVLDNDLSRCYLDAETGHSIEACRVHYSFGLGCQVATVEADD